MSTSTEGRADGDTADETDLAGAPIDLLLTDAAQGSWRRFLPSASTAHLAVGLARHPRAVIGRGAGLAADLARVAVGASDAEPAKKDRRFGDDAWTGNPFLHRLLQSYLVTSQAALDLVEAADLEHTEAQRMGAAVANLSDALAPSNHPALNPRAVKELIDTGGLSLVRGSRALVRDMAHRPRVPRMVDPEAFTVGETVAATPGHVVARTEQMELIQYTPTTAKVRQIPLLIIPPTINKFYVIDMAPGRSLVEYLVGEGHQVFVLSWRNPDVRHADWDADTYGAAIVDAMEITRRISGRARTALLSLCSGGMLTSMVLAHLAHIGELNTVAASALSVTVLDQEAAGLPGALLSQGVAEAAVRASAQIGYLDGRSLAEVFAWLRPNDLIWNYWVESYLLGRPTKPFDVLFWNADTTRMPAGLHRDFIHLAQKNALATPGAATMLGSPVDLSTIDVDNYVTAGIADHLCPWQNCYASTQLYGGESRFVLSTSGHIASIVNPPGNPKAHFRVAADTNVDADTWLEQAEIEQGSWWPDFSAWLHKRSGRWVLAPKEAGGPDDPVLEPAPGSYVRVT